MLFPSIDPVALQLGPLAIRWYALAYIAGIMLGWMLFSRLEKRAPLTNLTKKALDDMLVWVVAGIILGGRLGYVFFYKPGYYLDHPLEALQPWHGGMSFHGGLIGTILAFWLFARRHNIPFLRLMDLIACVVPIGLFFGRIANFINGELWGRVTDVPWGVVFPNGGLSPRHPSQLYEAGLEGLLLFAVLMVLFFYTRLRHKPGALAGVFLIGYGLSRMFVECFRAPDAQLGFIFSHVTMGQILCVPMLLIGLFLLLRKTNAAPRPA